MATLPVVASCRSDPTAPLVKEPPLRVYSTVPADDAEFVGNPVSIVVTFFEEPDLATLHLQVFPPPASSGAPVRAGRAVTWPDVVLDERPGAAVLLVDGPTMTAPFFCHFYPDGRLENHGRCAGTVTRMGSTRRAENTLILAFRIQDSDSLLEDSLPEILAREPESGVLATRDPTLGSVEYTLSFLEIDASYAIVGILDSSGDGQYVPGDDLWGYYSPSPGRVGEVVARGFLLDTPFPRPDWRIDIDVDVR